MPSFSLILPVTAVFAFAAAAGQSHAADPAELRVMTFNLRYATAPDGGNAWERRKEITLETIERFQPDLLGTQEVLAVQADFLEQNLPEYTLVGVGRDDGKRAGEFSALLFKTARFDLVASGTFWLSETPDQPGSKSWDSSLPRIVTWAQLADRQSDGRAIFYLNTHWDHRGNRARVESAKIIRRWIAQHAGQEAVIVTGDLNVSEDHEGYRTLVSSDAGEPRLADVYRQVHPAVGIEEATFHNFAGGRRGKRIDFIFASPQFKPIAAAIDHSQRDGRYPSDHYPVTAVLQMAPPEGK